MRGLWRALSGRSILWRALSGRFGLWRGLHGGLGRGLLDPWTQFVGSEDLGFAVRVGEDIGFVRQFRAPAFEALELFQSAAVIALSLDAVTKREIHQVRFPRDAAETFGQAEIPVLVAGDIDVRSEEHTSELQSRF